MKENSVELLVAKLDDIRSEDLSYSDGIKEAIRFTKGIGGNYRSCEEGIVIILGSTEIHVFQPYPDIDRIYYEY